MLYELECWAIDNKTKQWVNVLEIKMLRLGVRREDRIRNELIQVVSKWHRLCTE